MFAIIHRRFFSIYSPLKKSFDSVPIVSERTLAALQSGFKFKEMTEVQEKVLSLLPTEKDLLVRAKTGTGKTLAFVIASLESALARRPTKTLDGKSIPMLIIAPTRELAFQIAQEASKLLYYHRCKVYTAVGGTNRSKNVYDIESQRVDLLVATPGRLIDILESSRTAAKRVGEVETFILDEGDQLLDMGFRGDIVKISSFLNPKKQTFLFSATVSKEVKGIADSILKRDYDYIDTVPADDVPTHLAIKQSYFVSPFSQQIFALYDIIKKHKDENPKAKIIVFFSSAKFVSLMSYLFNSFPGMDILELHSKMTQLKRRRVSDQFRRALSSIMFTTDVSARGVDYPGVTLVVQMGIPQSKDQYIHRIGRTGRAGKSGEAVMVLSPYERAFHASQLSEFPMKEELRYNPEAVMANKELTDLVKNSLSKAQFLSEQCYIAFLNFYGQNRKSIGFSMKTCMQSADEFATGFLQMKNAPELDERTQERLGIRSFVKNEENGKNFGGFHRSYGGNHRNFGGNNRSFGRNDRSYGDNDRSFGRNDRNYGDNDRNFGGYDKKRDERRGNSFRRY